jgi:16S rRNA (guanine527-N7)-methyltransferase
VCIFPKGRSAAHELTAAAAQWHMHAERFPSPTDPQATILRISEISRVGNDP